METVSIQTTQNVTIDYELAKASTRVGGYLIDLILYSVTWFFLGMLLGVIFYDFFDLSAQTIFGTFFFGFLAYYFLLETFNRGQTVGKRATGTRVIRLDGRDPTPADFMARSIFLLVDAVFSFGIPAVLLISSSKNKQRFGDMVGGTAVIVARPTQTFTLKEILSIRNRDDHEPEFPGVQKFTDADMMVVKQTLTRLRRYRNPGHKQACRQLSLKLVEQLELDPKAVPYGPEKFLERILLDYIVLTR